MPVATRSRCGRRSRLAVVALLGLTWPVAAQAQPVPGGPPVVLEGHMGINDPLGALGLALVYDRGYRFSAGAGLGFDALDGESLLTASLLARARIYRRGRFALDLGLIASRGSYATERDYRPPATAAPDPGEKLISTWQPDYRATGTLAAELAGARWALRLEAGLAYHFGHPTCHYEGSGYEFTGDCGSPLIPEVYHLAMVPGRISPSLSVTLGYRLGVPEPADLAGAAASPDYRSPSMALHLSLLSTAIPALLGTTMLAVWANGHHDNDTFVTAGLLGLGLGIGFGPSIGYAYAGEHLRAWGAGALRLAGVAIGVAGFAAAGLASSCDECSGSGAGGLGAATSLLLVAATISAFYDVVTAPNAARRANARRGLPALTLAPVPVRDATGARPGLSLLGRF